MDIFQSIIPHTSLNRHSSVSEDGTIRKSTNFLNLPIELRIMIFESYFAMSEYIPVPGEPIPDPAPWRKLEPIPASLFSHYARHYVRGWYEVPFKPIKSAKAVSANDKVSLLRASKAVYADARPIFYLHHTFTFARGNWNFLQCDLDRSRDFDINYQPLNWLTKIELTNHKRYFPDPYEEVEKANVYMQLFVLEEHCPRLRHLVLELYFWSGPKHHAFEFLSDFSGRLSYLEIRVQAWNWRHGPLSNDLERIAPLSSWIDGRKKMLEGYTIHDDVQRPVHSIQQNSYILDRSQVAKKDDSSAALVSMGRYVKWIGDPILRLA